ncbi:MAG TPA: MgtC/SapB family protein [Gaiellaceae bacterium]|jgi:putative Mg2+ transporter-C (MgtC) family protein|nr:MgtC/SapB family protein [Gaiellaceae bacterium]
MSLATSLATLSWYDALGRLALAAALGSIIGLEREFREREAGLRTHLLVSLGSALFTIVSAFGFHDVLTHDPQVVVRLDPSRIAAQIVSGIGFLGAGAIIRQGLSIRGLTTAATLWVVAAIGMAAGAGFYSVAIITTVVALVALWPLRYVAYRMIDRVKPEEDRVVIELREGHSLAELLTHVSQVRHIEVTEELDRKIVQLESPAVDEELVARLSDLDFVVGVKWRR